MIIFINFELVMLMLYVCFKFMFNNCFVLIFFWFIIGNAVIYELINVDYGEYCMSSYIEIYKII